MSGRLSLGQVLKRIGRISDDDVEAALEYQRGHGGYFGQALRALGLLSAEELEWGLASQFDLPFIFPDPAAVDRDAAALVTPEWALARLTLPIVKTGDRLTVVTDSPLRTEVVEELATRTGLEIDLALAPADRIRDLIRTVFDENPAGAEGGEARPVPLDEALRAALSASASRFGISARETWALFWSDQGGTVARRRLDRGWRDDLDDALVPAPSRHLGEGERPAGFSADLRTGDGTVRVDVRYLPGAGGGREFLFRPVPEHPPAHAPFPEPPPELAAEVRLLARSGAGRMLVRTEPPALGEGLVPHLPRLFFGPEWRAVHLVGEAAPPPGDAFTVVVPDDAGAALAALEGLRAFHFDAVTVDLPGP
ncbi:MAG: hypothetical protein RQ751_07235, partial [Longimicrobiales bacterium]|nr:hypothetical protein [Longimicrobiales bacterium]